MTQAIQKTLRDSAGMRWTALLLLALGMFCSYIFMDILSPIKDLMQDTRGWDSTAFGTMQGSEVFLNVFVFFLIFAGIILDKMGVRFTAILSGAVMLFGAIVKWYAVSDGFIGSSLETWFTNNLNYIPGFDELGVSPFYQGMPASAKLAACGFMIFGCGCEMAGITVSRGIVKWFKGREMALAMGSEMALARLGVATCMIFSPFFAKLGGQVDVSRSVAFGVVLLCIALIMTIVYFTGDFTLNSIEWIKGEIIPEPDISWEKVEKKVFTDIETVDHEKQNGNNYIDITVPANREGPFPVIFWIHGGGWQSMSRKSCILDDTKEYLLYCGYAFVSAEYTLVNHTDGRSISPKLGMIHDLKAAVRFIRANAKKYNLNTNYIVAMGESAGGHLALLMGTTNGNPKHEDLSMGNSKYSSDVHLAAGYFAPTTFLVTNTSSTEDITSGVLPTERGGTGISFVDEDELLVGSLEGTLIKKKFVTEIIN